MHIETTLLQLFLGLCIVVFFNYATVKEMNRSVGVTGEAWIVSHHTDGSAVAVQLT